MLGCEWREYVEQLRLAEVAAVPVVGPIAVSVHLVRTRRQLSYAETVGERGRRTPLGLRQRAGVGRRRDDPIGAERSYCRGQQERRVGAAGVGDEDRAELPKVRVERTESRRG